MQKKLRRPLHERFWEKVKKTQGCWEFVGARVPTGYGTVYAWGKVRKAHRVSWEMANGPIPGDLCVLHKCDNPPCVRPDHLFLGTQLDNCHDKKIKGRARTRPRFGEENPSSKLTEQEAVEILLSDESTRDIALAFGVSPATVRDIKARRRWPHVAPHVGSRARGRHTLTDEDRQAIVASDASTRMLAESYGVTTTRVRQIKRAAGR